MQGRTPLVGVRQTSFLGSDGVPNGVPGVAFPGE